MVARREGFETPNRQIRSQPSPVPTRPPDPSASSLVLVNGRIGPESGIRPRPSRVAWSQCGRSFGSILRAVFKPEHQILRLVLYIWTNGSQPLGWQEPGVASEVRHGVLAAERLRRAGPPVAGRSPTAAGHPVPGGDPPPARHHPARTSLAPAGRCTCRIHQRCWSRT
jgi:hypothetical protein